MSGLFISPDGDVTEPRRLSEPYTIEVECPYCFGTGDSGDPADRLTGEGCSWCNGRGYRYELEFDDDEENA